MAKAKTTKRTAAKKRPATKAPAKRAALPDVVTTISGSAVETVLVLRTCAADMTARGGFRWPMEGPVAAPDWDPAPVCGGGLHGLLWGEGNGQLLSWEPGAKWLVVEVEKRAIVDLGGEKVKFPRGVVVHVGDQRSATEYLLARAPAGKAIVAIGETPGVEAGVRYRVEAGAFVRAEEPRP